jgi:hypothetical protein
LMALVRLIFLLLKSTSSIFLRQWTKNELNKSQFLSVSF